MGHVIPMVIFYTQCRLEIYCLLFFARIPSMMHQLSKEIPDTHKHKTKMILGLSSVFRIDPVLR